jgi:aminopeptidase N
LLHVIRRLAAMTVAAAVAAVLPPAVPSAPAQPATSRASAPHGAPGIGDPYFPLDGNGGIDVVSYDVHDTYELASRRLSGWTRITLQATRTMSGFDLDLLLPVRSVRSAGKAVAFRKRPHELVIARRVRAGEVLRLVVRYAGRPGRHTYAGESNWLADAHEVVAMNQPHMAPWWFPANDHPRDKARMRVAITVPRHLAVVSNGRQVARRVHGRTATTTWRADEPMVPYLAFFAAGHFDVARGTHDGLPWLVAVSTLLPTAERTAAMASVRRTPAVVEWLQGRLGPYPFSTTGGLVTSLDPGFSLENQTRPTYSRFGATDLPTVVHELAHQWFGDSVSIAGWKDIWLNEGAATFMEALYAEDHGGPSAQRWMRSTYDANAAGDDFWRHRVADPCPSHVRCVDRIFASWVYQRGAMALQALRNVVGEDDFSTLLRRWVGDRAGGNGSTADFEALAESVSGEDLQGFFDAWLRSTTKPTVGLSPAGARPPARPRSGAG